MKDLYEIYSGKPSDKSLEGLKQKTLSSNSNLNPIYKATEKNNNWVGYSSSSSSERLDSDSEEDRPIDTYLEMLSKGIEIDENVKKVKLKEYATSDDVKWLGVKPHHLESHSLLPKENPKTIYRDSNGAIIDSKAEKKEHPNEQRLKKWASGEVQLNAKKAMEDLLEAEKEKPFARHEIDEDYAVELKKKQRFGDPANRFVQQPVKKSKFSWENRYSIEPGTMWDGVDRSNGFEQRFLAKQGRKVWENSKAHQNFASEL